jgi:hypothetical protein
MDAVTGFREAIKQLTDQLHALGDSRPPDHRNQRDRILKDYYLAYETYGDQFVRDVISTPEDRITAFDMADTMAPSERTTPRQWLIEHAAVQWAKKAGLVTACFRLLNDLLGPSRRVERERLARNRFRQFFSQPPDRMFPGEDATEMPPGVSAGTLSAKTQTNFAEPPAAESRAQESPAIKLIPAGTAESSKLLPDPAVLEQRRVELKGFIERYLQKRDYKLIYAEIAILAHQRNRSAVQKFLSGHAGPDCARNIEEILRMSPEGVDERCKAHSKQLPRLTQHLVGLGTLGAPGRS